MHDLVCIVHAWLQTKLHSHLWLIYVYMALKALLHGAIFHATCLAMFKKRF